MTHDTTNDATNAIPYGYCRCGCGQKTKIATKTRHRLMHVPGKPMIFINGHSLRMRVHPSPEDRLWSRVDKTGGPDACWPWMGKLNEDGYGKIRGNDSAKSAMPVHRFAYEITCGPIQDGLLACHTCNNPPCCNPKHIYAGTHKDNAQDSIKAGTFYFLREVDNHKTRLTPDKVAFIRHMRLVEHAAIRDIAAQFCVDQATIWDAVLRRTWKHVP